MLPLIAALALLVPAPAHPDIDGDFLAFTQTPRGAGNLLGRNGVVGHSAQGRPIEMHQLGDPKWPGELLIFGCIHGDECDASGIEPVSSLTAGCPDPGSDIYLVPNLDPDGSAAGTRLNADGVDLNRNFNARWRPLGQPGDAEYSGPRPFSEPETRLTARIIRALDRRHRSGFTSTGAGVPSSALGGRARLAPATSRLWPGCRSGRCAGRRGRRRTGRTTASRRRPSSSSCPRGDWRRRCGAG